MNTACRLSTGGGSRLGTAGGREGSPKRNRTPSHAPSKQHGSSPLGLGPQKQDEPLHGKQLYAETFKLDDMREELDEFVTYRLPQPSLSIGRAPSPRFAKAVKR